MNFQEALENFGRRGAIASVYEHLKGVNFDEIDILKNEDLLESFFSPDHYNKWFFLNNISLTLVCFSDKATADSLLDNLACVNDLTEVDECYYGIGFKLYRSEIKNKIWAVSIEISDIIPSSIANLENTKKGIKVNWIKGIHGIINSSQIQENSRRLSMHINKPIWFDYPVEHILIPKKNEIEALDLVKLIISVNGGEQAFKSLESDFNVKNEWSNAYEGRKFVVGFIKSLGVVRINRVITTVENNEIEEHKLAPLIRTLVPGIDDEILTFWNEDLGFPVYFSESETAQEVYFAQVSNPITLSRFSNIVLKNSQEDPFLKIDPQSIITWLLSNKNRKIYFDNKNRFSCTLSSEKNLLILCLSASRDQNFLWTDMEINSSVNKTPVVEYSEPFKLEKIVSRPKLESNTPDNLTENTNHKFFEENVLRDDVVKKENINTNKNNVIYKLLFALVGILLLFVLLKSCQNSDSADYYYNSGLDEYSLANYSDAKDDFSRAIEIDPNYVNAYKERSRVNIQENNPREAIIDIDKAISIDQADWELYFLSGRAKMLLANSKFSSKNKEAILDFIKSTDLNSNSENAKSFYYRGRVREYIEDDSACIDYYQACAYNFEDSCDIVDKICYPKTGFMPYNQYFGPGIIKGDYTFEIDNSRGDTDLVASLVQVSTNKRVRAQFVRSGSSLLMKGIPEGLYKLQLYEGKNWSNSMLLKDGISKGGFLINPNFTEIESTWRINKQKQESGIILNSIEGDLSSKTINENEFFK